MYPLAVEHGIAAEKYWVMTYEEIIIQVEANTKIEQMRLKEQAHFDYMRAKLISFSVNDPKKMPKVEEVYPFLKESEAQLSPEEKYQSEIQKEQQYMIARAMQIQAARKAKEVERSWQHSN